VFQITIDLKCFSSIGIISSAISRPLPFHNYHVSLSRPLHCMQCMHTGIRVHDRCLCPNSVFANTKTGNAASHQVTEHVILRYKSAGNARVLTRVRAYVQTHALPTMRWVYAPPPPSLSLSLSLNLLNVLVCCVAS